MKELRDIAEQWKARASSAFVPTDVREAVYACANELYAVLNDHDNELLSPKEAAQECGLAPATIRKKLSSGDWPNEGTPYRPKVRRRALREAIGERAARKMEVVR